MNIITVNIRKPLYGNYVYINGTLVERAIRLGYMLEIIIPKGRAIVDPKEWKKNGKIMKKVFNFPNRPMFLYGGNLQIPSPYKGEITTPEKEKENEKQQKLF